MLMVMGTNSKSDIDGKGLYELAADDERRAYSRLMLRRDGKLLWRGLSRAVPVRTVDVSEGGARVHVPGERLPGVGQAVEVVVVSSSTVLVPRAALRSATVVRVDDGTGHVAVRFDEPASIEGLLAAPPRELAAA